jgi:hypothetical protein
VRAQRDSAEKPSKFRLNELMAKNEDRDPLILYLLPLVMDCYWCGFGRIRDKFDLIITLDEIANRIQFGTTNTDSGKKNYC